MSMPNMRHVVSFYSRIINMRRVIAIISPLALRVTLNRVENLITPGLGFGSENFLGNSRSFFVANL